MLTRPCLEDPKCLQHWLLCVVPPPGDSLRFSFSKASTGCGDLLRSWEGAVLLSLSAEQGPPAILPELSCHRTQSLGMSFPKASRPSRRVRQKASSLDEVLAPHEEVDLAYRMPLAGGFGECRVPQRTLEPQNPQEAGGGKCAE